LEVANLAGIRPKNIPEDAKGPKAQSHKNNTTNNKKGGGGEGGGREGGGSAEPTEIMEIPSLREKDPLPPPPQRRTLVVA